MKTPFKIFIISAFLIGIAAPFISGGLFFETSKTPIEKNIPWKPALSFEESIRSFIDYYNHRFGLRYYFIVGYSTLLVKVFHISPHPPIVVGRKNWLYYHSETRPLTVNDLRLLTEFFVKKAAWLKKQGISYYIVIAPNKETVYPEYLPHKKFFKKLPRSFG